MRQRFGWMLVVGLAVVALTACPGVMAFNERGSFDRTLKVTGAVDLEVQTGSGSITVRNGGADTVQIHATITATGDEALAKVRKLEANPPIEQTANSIRIGRIDDPDLRRNVSISYEIITPLQTQLRSHSGSGHLTVEGIKGPVTAETGSGGITITNIGSEVRAHTGSGGIEFNNIQASARAEAGSGSIRANSIAGSFDGHTGSGHINLVQAAPGSVRAESGSGSIELENVKGGLSAGTGSGTLTISGEPTAAWDVHTGSGRVTLRLPQQVAFDLYAHTGSGRVTSDHPVTIQGTFTRNELRGKVRGGGVPVEIRTGSGNVLIQ